MALFSIDDLKSEPIEEKSTKGTKRRTTPCLELSTKTRYRRAFSETQLLDATPDELKEGFSYHYLTQGDVDALSYLRLILRKKKNLDYILVSTWVISCADISQLDEWLHEGRIKEIDFYVGEIFPMSYVQEWIRLKAIQKRTGCRLVVSRNHSKVIAGFCKGFHFVWAGSANINTNPRTENGCITISKDAFDFYKSFYDKINTIQKL